MEADSVMTLPRTKQVPLAEQVWQQPDQVNHSDCLSHPRISPPPSVAPSPICFLLLLAASLSFLPCVGGKRRSGSQRASRPNLTSQTPTPTSSIPPPLHLLLATDSHWFPVPVVPISEARCTMGAGTKDKMPLIIAARGTVRWRAGGRGRGKGIEKGRLWSSTQTILL